MDIDQAKATAALVTPGPTFGADVDIDKVTRAYVHIRDARSTLSADFKEKDDALKAKLATLEGVLLARLNAQGAKSITTDSGIVYRQEEITPTGADWERFYEWIREQNAFDALERRIKKNFIKQWMDDHEGGIPPGVSVFKEFVVRVRRS